MENENIEVTENTEEKKETYSAEEVEQMLQREADKRVTQALQKREKEFSKKLRESEKLAKMSESEKAEHERQNFLKQLEEKESELNRRENKIEGLKILSEKGLPSTLIDFVIDEDADAMFTKIQSVDKIIKAAVAEQVKSKLATPSPKMAVKQSDEISKEQFMKMTVAQRAELYKSNPELYKELSR
ncbi:MAG: DUF4355 domain-containing protein [Eubacteriales bacterium]|nr:DUF4355 domain-containing protein [Eubacteriales bacterium]